MNMKILVHHQFFWVIVFVSYSLGAPEIIESQSRDQNHGLEHSSDQGLEKQEGYGDGNVKDDPSATKNLIEEFRKYGGSRRGGTSNGGGRPGSREMCVGMCTIACASGSETMDCLTCMSRC
ncbi:uncharacterized protein LOC132945684 [Metopolophium dirhodum]|uniref:uncharacterized protein LOC132945684 n=1 Tax=Metopolophium dirhodum TaxID=44670 RepID=UPI00299065D6|nr:uncharacterized protein LOC132945684 [Metopolophium dirhodum]